MCPVAQVGVGVGVAVGLIDGFVYLGMGLQSLIFGLALPEGAARHVQVWRLQPCFPVRPSVS